MVEHRLPKPGVEGSNPFSRSIIFCCEATLKSVVPVGCSIKILILRSSIEISSNRECSIISLLHSSIKIIVPVGDCTDA